MKINKDVIGKLDPCKDRFDNYLKHYAGKKHTRAQFMGLKNITHQDKLWVAFRLMPQGNAVLAAADIAESVLHIYESKHPNDDRPRRVIQAARDYQAGKITIEQLRSARSAAYAAYAAYAAADAAYAAADAAYAAYAAADAAYAAYAAAANGGRAAQEKRARTICLKYWKE